MALYYSDMFRKIARSDLMHRSWTDPKKGTHFYAMIEHSNNFCFWLQNRILDMDGLSVEELNQQRTSTVVFFLEVANKCVELGNFNGAMVIHAGLNAKSVSRLNFIWDNLPKKSNKILQNLNDLFSFERNYHSYREKFAESKANGPAIPYLGIVSKDVFAVEESNPTTLENGLINFHKFRMLFSHVQEIEKLQKNQYTYPKTKFYDYLSISIIPFDTNYLYELSLKVLPRKNE
uniref:Ras-GEF domain-containing protein n=1 Tax=Arcella intermedia TaxID=1963864 RepID=A0A6B2LG31_9EUKA